MSHGKDSIVLAVVRQMCGAARHGRLAPGAVSAQDVAAAARLVLGLAEDEPLTEDEAWTTIAELAFAE